MATTMQNRPETVPGVIMPDTLRHLLDVEFARARRYEHPFSVMRVCVPPPGDAAALRGVAGALRLHTRWADSVGFDSDGALLVILRDTPARGAGAVRDKVAVSLREELGAEAVAGLRLTCAAWRKGDDRARLLARLD